VKLSKVLGIQSQSKSDLLILGDGYLLNQSPIYRRIREDALNLGFTFSTNKDTQYEALPMSQLESVIESRVIPYVDNVSPLQKLNQQTNGQLNWEHVADNLRPNYIFHESCHAVARSKTGPSDQLKKTVVKILLEESFANTCEFLAIADANEPIHRIFLDMNSYFTVYEDRTHLKKAISQYGFESMYQFMLLCYLYSNFLNEFLSDSEFSKIIALAGFQVQPDKKVLKSLAKYAFELNPSFRYNTTELYFRMRGYSQPIKELLNFNPIDLIASDSEIRNWAVFQFSGSQSVS
jgi:hypothetical protein